MIVKCYDCHLPVKVMKAAAVAVSGSGVIRVCMRCFKKNYEPWLNPPAKGTSQPPTTSNS